jgi:hypothetical protein
MLELREASVCHCGKSNPAFRGKAVSSVGPLVPRMCEAHPCCMHGRPLWHVLATTTVIRYPGLRSNAVDLSRMILIQNLCFRRGLGIVIPAEAGIHTAKRGLDPGLRRGDGVGRWKSLKSTALGLRSGFRFVPRLAGRPAEKGIA